MEREKIDIAVLGGGLAGLSAASRVIDKGGKPTVIEKEETVGGLCRSVKRNGFTFDLGGHRFLPNKKETTDFISSLFSGKELCIRDRSSKIYLKDKFLTYPPEFSDILKNLGLLTCVRGGVDSAFFRLRKTILRRPEISLKDWLLNRFGPTLYDIYFGPYSFKLWGRRPSFISSDWAPKRISVPSIGVAVKSLFVNDRNPSKTYAKKYLYPADGIGEMPARLSRKIASEGSTILTDSKVTKVAKDKDRFIIETTSSRGEKKVLSASKVLSTIPLTELVEAFDSSFGEDLQSSAKNLQFRSVRFLNIMLDTSRITNHTWIYIPERKYIFFRIQEFPNWHPNTAPRQKTSLTLEIACDKDGRLWNMKDDVLLERCVEDLKKLGVDLNGKIIDYFCTYAEHAYPVYSLRYKNYLQRIYDFIYDLDNFNIGGRQGLFSYLNMDRAIENGFEAAESLYDKDRKKDFLKPCQKKEYLEKDLYLKKHG